MLSDQERRALAELELSLISGTTADARPGRRRGRLPRPPGRRTALVVGALVAALLVSGAATAALALASAAAIGWAFWWSCSPPSGDGRPPRDAHRRPGESVRQYLRWLAEAE